MNLKSLRTLGRSGLPVSPLCLGTMTFGRQDWGSPDTVSQSIFDSYVDAGGNFIDTADVYAVGRSEELVGQFIAERNLRDQLVLATKYTWNSTENNPLAGGNGRKNLNRALEGSLQRLGTDYIDLYWVHAWDKITPVEEVVQSLSELVSAGKIRYYGFSNVPAWYTARAATLAQTHNVPGPIALQMEYSLVERSIENEHIPAAQELGLGIVPWSPLAFGFLTGKYSREDQSEQGQGEGRLNSGSPMFQKFSESNWKILDALREVSEEANLSLPKVALSWALSRPGITSLILGASKVEQLHDNIASLEVELTPQQLTRLSDASAPAPLYPYTVFSEQINSSIFNGISVQPWR
ncbi:aldo/keto reductase [bacterium]|nr:MAG: aldo/keto reductase [bacterium]